MKKVLLEDCCPKCGGVVGIIKKTGPHQKLLCYNCSTYIKMIGKKELETMREYKEDSTTIDEKINELNFKLDIIIEYLEELKSDE